MLYHRNKPQVYLALLLTDSDYPVGIFKLFVMPISYISFFFLIYIFILLLISKFKLLHKKHNICISMYMYAVVGKWLSNYHTITTTTAPFTQGIQRPLNVVEDVIFFLKLYTTASVKRIIISTPIYVYYPLLYTRHRSVWKWSENCLKMFQPLIPQVEQELITLSEHLGAPPVLVGFVLLDL
jgi:hypothetical protein